MGKRLSWSNLTAWLLLGFLAITHIYLISKTFFVDAMGNFRAAFESYGDLPLHLTQISKFAFGKLTDLGDPIFYGAKLQYPFAINLISGLWLKITHNWELAVLAPVIVLAITNIFLLQAICRRFLKNNLWAALAVIIFFLGSGWGAYTLVLQTYQQGQSPGEYFRELANRNITTTAKFDATANEQNINYSAPLSMSFLHQRAFFLGLFGFLMTWLLLLKMKEKYRWFFPILAGVILGLMPLWHSHSFIAALILMAAFFILAWRQKDWSFLRRLGLTLAIGAALAIPQGLFLINSKELLAGDKGFFQFRLGWMTKPGIGSVQFGSTEPSVWNWRYLEFLWINFGIILPVFLTATGALLFKRFRNSLAQTEIHLYSLYAAIGLACFIAVQTIQFQPWDYDNNKLLVYWQLMAVLITMLLLKKFTDYKKFLGIFAIGVFILLTATAGIIENIPRFIKDRQQIPIIFDLNAQKTAQFIKENINENDLILTGAGHLNPVASLAGRPVMVGYPGWLWTRGINYQSRYSLIKNFYQQPARTSELLKKYPIKYILLDSSTQHDFAAQKEVFDSFFNKIFEAGNFLLYKV